MQSPNFLNEPRVYTEVYSKTFLFFSISSIPLSRDIPKAHSSGAQLIHKVWALDSIQQGSQSPCFLNKIIDILENHSESLSFSLSLQEKRGIEKKRETQNDSQESQSIYSKARARPLLFSTDLRHVVHGWPKLLRI